VWLIFLPFAADSSPWLTLAVALVGGTLVGGLVAWQRAPVDMATELASSATDHAAELRADNVELRARNAEKLARIVQLEASNERLERSVGDLTTELAAVRRDAAHDREEARQCKVAANALTDEVDRLKALCDRNGVTP
jgi:uncharacterized protein YlxW (UPF0749 family)